MAFTFGVAGASKAQTAARIDAETCAQLTQEQAKFIESGILADVERGPAVAGQSLTPERLREIQLFIMLDEQIKFGCRILPLASVAAAGESATGQGSSDEPNAVRQAAPVRSFPLPTRRPAVRPD